MKNRYILWLCISLPLFVLLLFIASTRSITHDEAYTYLNIVRGQSIWDILKFNAVIANNHILNSLLIDIIEKILPIRSEIYLRLPNVLAFILYSFSCFKISENLFESKKMQILSFILFLINPYVFEFFGLARGYGLAVAFMMASIACYLDYTKSHNMIKIYGLLFFASLSVLSNTVLLNYFVSIISILCLYEVCLHIPEIMKVKDNKRIFSLSTIYRLIVKLRKLLLPILLSCIMLIPTVISIIKLKKGRGFVFGGSNFITGTIGTLIKGSLSFEISDSFLLLLSVFIFMIFLLGLVFIVYLILKNKVNWSNNILTFFLLYISFGSTIIQFILFKTPLLTGRTGLFLIPLAFVAFCTILLKISRYFNKMGILLPILVLILSFSLVNFTVYSYNKCTLEWNYDCNDREVFETLVNRNEKEIYVTWIYYPSFSFYNAIDNKGLNIQMLESKSFDISKVKGYMYYYSGKEDYKIHKLDLNGFTKIKEFNQGGVILYKD